MSVESFYRRFQPFLAGLLVLVLTLVSCACSPGCANRSDNGAGSRPSVVESQPAPRTTLDIFAFGRVLGTIAPCGCTSDPLGGLAYAFGMMEARSEDGARVVLEPGSFLFPDPHGPEAPKDAAGWAQAEQRAIVLHRRFHALGDALVSGVGPSDFVSEEGAAALDKWPLPRVLTNLAVGSSDTTWSATPLFRRIELDHGLAVTVTAFVEPKTVDKLSGFPPLRDPVEAARTVNLESNTLKLALVQGSRPLAETIAGLGRFDIVVMGGELGDVDRGRTGSSPVLIGSTWLVEPGDRAQTITHARFSVAPGGEWPATTANDWAVVPSRETLLQQREHVDGQLSRFRSDPNADPAFLARLQNELASIDRQLAGDTSSLATQPVIVTFEQVKVRCSLPKDKTAAAALTAYDAWVAEANKKRFAGVTPPAPAPAQSHYVGTEECSPCHDEADEFWQTTRHAGAFATLEHDNKQYDVDCVGCHVTGFRQPGGSEVVENEGLRDVQCEQCHGPGSRHVDEPTDAADKPQYIERNAPVDVCLVCHTPEHSDTFDYEAYMRDVLGPGHGARAREALGQGPTGRELRAAAIQKAGGSCAKMGS